MSCSSAAATYSLSFPARCARVADWSECSRRVTLSGPWNCSSAATASISRAGSFLASSSPSASIRRRSASVMSAMRVYETVAIRVLSLASECEPIDVIVVRRLIESQFPEWSDLPITPVEPQGWDNRSFRLGSELVVRLPSAGDYAAQVEKEQRWLPVLGPRLPLPIPTPVAEGEPDAGFPYPWSIYRWLD